MHIDGLARFLEMYEAIVETMLIKSQNKDRTWNSCFGDATSFWSLLLNFNFCSLSQLLETALGIPILLLSNSKVHKLTS